MIILSLFDGMSCGQLALKKLGIEPELYMASEVDESAMKVTQRNFPNTKQLGDVTKVDAKSIPRPDLLIGGSPCQGFSFAGNQLNFQHPESKLFFEYARLLDELKPRLFLLENVVMKKEYEDVISQTLGVKPVLINSNLITAQNRKRLYWTNIEGVEQPGDRKIGWGQVREHGVKAQKHYYTHKAMQWLANESIKKGRPLNIHRADEKMQMLEANHHKKYSSQRFFAVADHDAGIDTSKFPVYGDGNPESGPIKIELKNGQLFATKDGKEHAITRPGDLPAGKFALRYVTPLECERLQTVPDGYSSPVSDTQRYRMLGNGWTVDVISHILAKAPK
jgi:DNA-cytosine methyltransferase